MRKSNMQERINGLQRRNEYLLAEIDTLRRANENSHRTQEQALNAYYRMQDKRFSTWAIGVAGNIPLEQIKEAFDWILNGDPEPKSDEPKSKFTHNE